MTWETLVCAALTQLLLQHNVEFGLLAGVQLAQHEVPRKGGHFPLRRVIPLLLRWHAWWGTLDDSCISAMCFADCRRYIIRVGSQVLVAPAGDKQTFAKAGQPGSMQGQHLIHNQCAVGSQSHQRIHTHSNLRNTSKSCVST